ncbi:hypothetical protein T4C_2687 [Trichinella pseudospiralis]|uniref:Uncharacterized protein n=1 Tax=Trichinella pseudospiralis TaxID=6337 RepID=A0A0V1K8L2_TRIPS|nr:hypothetical protein T4C_2687 [Trichinella pseudospiralis]
MNFDPPTDITVVLIQHVTLSSKLPTLWDEEANALLVINQTFSLTIVIPDGERAFAMMPAASRVKLWKRSYDPGIL